MYIEDYNYAAKIFCLYVFITLFAGLQSNSAYGLMMSVRLSTFRLILANLAFKFWNLLCNSAIPSSAVSCFLES